MKVLRLEYHINEHAGELKFRQFNSSEEVNGKMYVIVSKLTASNSVSFEIHSVDENETTQLVTKVTSIESFYKIIEAFEKDLRTSNPRVRMILNTNERSGITNHPMAKGGQMPQGVVDAIDSLGDDSAVAGHPMLAFLESIMKATQKTSPRVNKHQ